MRQIININDNWKFQLQGQPIQDVNIPHTWNNIDGQDGGNDYLRTVATYSKTFETPAHAESEDVFLEFNGVNSECQIILNGSRIYEHAGGYSTFRVNITNHLTVENHLEVVVDNSPNDRVYPQKADFTFYGGIYRDVNLLVVNKHRFDIEYFGGSGVEISAKPQNDYKDAVVNIKTWKNSSTATTMVTIYDMEGNVIPYQAMVVDERSVNQTTYSGDDIDNYYENLEIELTGIHLWDGVQNPYLYTAEIALIDNDVTVDMVKVRFGIRDFSYDAKRGFYLNGRSYPLHGVSRHQDRKALGNAITDEMHLEDMNLICEIGANTIRLAHYQHSQYFYDLCDERGMIVWAEIPYISEHMPNGRANTITQMKELIVQNYNHPSIVCWGVSNEITISTKNKKDMLDNHHYLNDLCHKMDSTRFTTLACYAMCGPFNPVAHITDTVSWNLYLGWYVPGLFLNDLWIRFFHMVYPNRPLGYSEYGCEGMPNLHSEHPHRGDHTEEYQARYHEYMLRCFQRNPFMWATHVWNMYDFAADARNQGGEPGMNHKGLVTFDRKIKKDSFYVYKAWWSDEPFVHIASKRFIDRTRNRITIKVYSNQKEVSLYRDGKLLETKTGQHVFEFKVKLEEKGDEPHVDHIFQAVSGELEDEAIYRKVDKPNREYKLKDVGDKGTNWADS
ncbi:MAG: glycoside hydrolase family 2 protein [Lachnospiraceae bacterium]|nr:glycoside hydrolase family 2 protein [Lachnospiraceae bacterium]